MYVVAFVETGLLSVEGIWVTEFDRMIDSCRVAMEQGLTARCPWRSAGSANRLIVAGFSFLLGRRDTVVDNSGQRSGELSAGVWLRNEADRSCINGKLSVGKTGRRDHDWNSFCVVV